MTSRTEDRGYRLPEPAERAEYIRQNFDAIAGIYDRFNDLITFGMHRGWKKRAVRLTGLARGSGSTVLDLCSGSGDLALEMGRHLGPDGRITAYDYSAGMLNILQQRLEQFRANRSRRAPRATVDVVQGDAVDLSRFDDESFDAVTIGFGLRNVQDRAACLGEVLRLLRPGARLVILDVGKIKNPVIAFFHRLHFEKIVPMIGHLLQGRRQEMFEYLPASAQIYPDQAALAEELRGLGFDPVTFQTVMLGAAVIHVATCPGGVSTENALR